MFKDKFITGIESAQKSIYSICKATPLDNSSQLSKLLNIDLFLKCEFQQYTGSFKLRGATNKLLKIINSREKEINIVTASSGNHGSAISYSCQKINEIHQQKLFNCIVYVPKNIDSTKQSIIENYQAIIRKLESTNSLDCEIAARKFVLNNTNSLYISPYNDIDIVSGQGTIGVEILNDVKPDAIFVSIGGGGLISGIAVYVKRVYPNCKIIGCQPENSRVMYESLKAGKILQDVDELETLSDGTAGGIEGDSLTFPIVKEYVDEIILANENEISNAFTLLVEKEKIIVEGSAALTLACLIKTKDNWKGKKVVLVLCGKNISLDKIKYILNK